MSILLYQQTKDPALGQQLLTEHKDTIDKHIGKWSGTLPEIVLKKHAHKYALDAFASFDLSKGANIQTHLYNHLSRLSRLNYENQNTMKIPEHQIRMISNYHDTVNYLKDKFNRDPESHEIADHMVIPTAHVERLQKNLRKEFISEGSDFDQFQTADIGSTDAASTRFYDTVSRLPKADRKVFDMVSAGKSPGEIGKLLNLKPYEVSRVKMRVAEHFKDVEG